MQLSQKSSAYALRVQVVHGPGDGAQHSAGLPLRETLLPKDAVQQLASPHQLHHQIHEFPIIIDLQQEHNKCMSWTHQFGKGWSFHHSVGLRACEVARRKSQKMCGNGFFMLNNLKENFVIYLNLHFFSGVCSSLLICPHRSVAFLVFYHAKRAGSAVKNSTTPHSFKCLLALTQ